MHRQQTIARIGGTLKKRLQRQLVQPMMRPLYIDRDGDYKASVLLAGTERSGTTWVADILNFKRDHRLIFEPFYIHKVPICARFPAQKYIRPIDRDPELLDVAHEILSGKIRNAWTDRFHRKVFVKKRIVKDVRANLFLNWLYRNFPGIPIILLLRHPCATALSQELSQHKFGDLQSTFLTQEQLIEDHLQPFLADINEARDGFEQRIFRWCIQNYVPLKQFKAGQIHLAFYENFCTEPTKEVTKMLAFLGHDYDQKVEHALVRPSPVSRRDSAIVSGESLIARWQNELTQQQVEKALEILRLFGLDKIYSRSALPNSAAAHRLLEA